MNTLVALLIGMFAIGAAVFTALMKIWKVGPFLESDPTEEDLTPPVLPPVPVATPPQQAIMPALVPPALLWDTQHNAFHSTRVICDEVGLTFEQKEILCACVFQESEFLTNPKPNENIDEKTGKVWSTDYGIVQVNDYYNIGKGKPFASVDEVLNNPEKCIRWMVGIYKATGRLQPWASYTSGVYKKHLLPNSRMRKLA